MNPSITGFNNFYDPYYLHNLTLFYLNSSYQQSLHTSCNYQPFNFSTIKEEQQVKIEEKGVQAASEVKIEPQSLHEQIEDIKLEQQGQESGNDSSLNEKFILKQVLQEIGQEGNNLKQLEGKVKQNGNQILLDIFNFLVGKYKKTKKTKEQIVKYIIRKCFRFIYLKLLQEGKQNLEQKQLLCKYFNNNNLKSTISLPFKPNSLEKTINASFLNKIFKLTFFANDYHLFLQTLSEQIDKDNAKKIEQFQLLLKKCVNSKNLIQIRNCKRLPWTKLTIQQIYTYSHKLPLIHCPSQIINQLPFYKQHPQPNNNN